MHRMSGFMAARFWLTLVLVVAGPILSACGVSTPPPVQADSHTPLPQAVEAYMADLPGPSPKLFMTTRIYDRQGVLLGEFWDEGHRYWVPLERISPAVRQATIATEDKSFYTNPGVDWSAIARAVLQNSGDGGVVSGASTITQQLARNIAMPYEKRLEQTLNRKLSETMLAQDLTQRFTKDQILEMYLNVVYYGHLAYGIEAAAHVYFAKNASDLTLGESALLAALPESPIALDPLIQDNLSRAKARQGLVLALMVRNGYIKQDEAQAAYNQPLQFRSEQIPNPAPHFLQYVHDYLEAQYGKDMVARGGFNVVTTLDLRMQARAEQIVRQQVSAVRARYNLSNAALVALRPATGEILAMVGSANFADASINGQVNVAVSPRQPGSSIKPVLYSLAFSRGMVPADMIADTPVAYPLSNGTIYRPVNYDGRYHGTVRLRQALANSYNVPAVKLLNQMTVPAMVEMGHTFGITTWTRPVASYGLALTLGGAEVTLLDLSGAYAVIANQGTRVKPTPLLRVSDPSGHQLPDPRPAPQKVIDPRVAYMVSSILSDNEARVPMFGSNSPLKLSRPAAAKTGTTTDWRDNWTMGYTPYLVTGVWAGNSNGQPMRNTTGLTGAAPIWHDFMEAVFTDPTLDGVVRAPGQALDFSRPAGLLDVSVCKVPSLGNGPGCPSGRVDLFIDTTKPITLGLPAGTTTITRPVPSTAIISAARPVGTVITTVQGIAFAPGSVCSTSEGGDLLTAVQLPADAAQRQSVQQWAAQSELPLYTGPCTTQTVAAQSAQSAQTAPPAADNTPVSNSAQIAFPVPGAIVSGPIDVIGSAVFDTNEFQFYKVEFGYGGNPGQWITIGSGHGSPVSAGRLETLHADSLPAGPYALRVVLVKRDGNYVVSPPVPIQITH